MAQGETTVLYTVSETEYQMKVLKVLKMAVSLISICDM